MTFYIPSTPHTWTFCCAGGWMEPRALCMLDKCSLTELGTISMVLKGSQIYLRQGLSQPTNVFYVWGTILVYTVGKQKKSKLIQGLSPIGRWQWESLFSSARTGDWVVLFSCLRHMRRKLILDFIDLTAWKRKWGKLRNNWKKNCTAQVTGRHYLVPLEFVGCRVNL